MFKCIFLHLHDRYMIDSNCSALLIWKSGSGLCFECTSYHLDCFFILLVYFMNNWLTENTLKLYSKLNLFQKEDFFPTKMYEVAKNDVWPSSFLRPYCHPIYHVFMMFAINILMKTHKQVISKLIKVH